MTLGIQKYDHSVKTVKANEFVQAVPVTIKSGADPAATVHGAVIGMIDLEDNDKWIELGSSRAWGWPSSLSCEVPHARGVGQSSRSSYLEMPF